MTWAEQDRFAERTMLERVFSRLKDEFGARFIRVRGASKIMAHLMFGVLALTVDQLLKLSG
jgi:transposase